MLCWSLKDITEFGCSVLCIRPHSLLWMFWKILHSLLPTAQYLLTSPTIVLYHSPFPCLSIGLFVVPTIPNLLLYSHQLIFAFTVTSVENVPAWSSRIFSRSLAWWELHKKEKRHAMDRWGEVRNFTVILQIRKWRLSGVKSLLNLYRQSVTEPEFKSGWVWHPNSCSNYYI